MILSFDQCILNTGRVNETVEIIQIAALPIGVTGLSSFNRFVITDQYRNEKTSEINVAPLCRCSIIDIHSTVHPVITQSQML